MKKIQASLTLVPTPIGNLEDITYRAIAILKNTETILAEDTRTSGVLLKHYGIEKKLQSFHIFNEHKTLTSLIHRMKAGETMALISDAGTPGISDPGFLLVRECLKNDLTVECLPGPTAFVPALVKSGFPTDRFVFEGFLPHKKGRQTILKRLAEEDRTVIFYESPHRLVKALAQMMEFFGPERFVSVSRELTKLYEETKTGTLLEVLTYFQNKEVKGEIVIVADGNRNKINVGWLFAGGSVLISSGWFMKPFPIFIFVGLAPFFAILDHTIESKKFWENLELILLGMAVYFFSACQLDASRFLEATLLAILFTLPFLAFSFTYVNLGPRTGKFIIIIFWMALEYAILSLGAPKQTIFLADALQATSGWYRWNLETGYLGVSAWILLVNWLLYAGLLKGAFNGPLVGTGLFIMVGPIAYSLWQDANPVLREDMIELYGTNMVSNKEYPIKGELVARTCAWLSALIILFAVVKSRIQKS